MTATQPVDPTSSDDERAARPADLELWARCGACDEWFPLPSDTLEAMATARCPVCDGGAEAFEERYGAVRFPIEIS